MSLSLQFLSLLAMIGTGIATAAFMDMIGTGIAATRKVSFVRRRATIFEVIGWLIAGCWTFYILYNVRDGGWRIYDPFAQLSGMFLYISVFHKPIRLLGRIVFLLFIKPVWLVVYMIVSIIRKIFSLLIKIVLLLLTPFIKLFSKLKVKRFKKKV